MPLNADALSRIRQNLSALNQNAGETATWRQYISASAGLAEYGQGTAQYYVNRLVTAQFFGVKPMEIWQAGGQILAGDLWCLTPLPISERDEVQYEGGRYMAVGEPIAISLFGSAASKVLLRRA